MMKYFFIVILIVALTPGIKAQRMNIDTTSVQPRTLVRLSLIAPGLLVEQRIANSATLIFNLWTGFAFQYAEVNGRAVSYSRIYPNFTIEPRFYSSIKKRKVIVSKSNYYSGPYFGFPVTIGFNYSRFSVGPVIGYMQGLGRKGYWNVAVGPGVTGAMGITQFGFIGGIGIGFILN